jgi:hypothetical protein
MRTYRYRPGSVKKYVEFIKKHNGRKIHLLGELTQNRMGRIPAGWINSGVAIPVENKNVIIKSENPSRDAKRVLDAINNIRYKSRHTNEQLNLFQQPKDKPKTETKDKPTTPTPPRRVKRITILWGAFTFEKEL